MKYGVSFPQSEAGSDVKFLQDFVLLAEELNYQFVSAPEHVLQAETPEGTSFAKHYSIESSFHEIMTTLAYWAAITTSIELVASILVIPQRQAVVAAKQAAQIDLLSRGRLRLGVGLGWNKAEFLALGMPYHARRSLMTEQIEVMRQLWTKRIINFKGEWHQIRNMGLNPTSLQKPIPIWIGAMARPAITRAAKIADGWFINPRQNPNSKARREIKLFRETGKAAGRNEDQLGINATIFLSEGKGPRAWKRIADTWRNLEANEVTFRTSESGLTSYSEHFDALRMFADAVEL